MASVPQPRARAPLTPYIMPDGRPLGAFLSEASVHAGRKNNRKKGRSKGSGSDKWERGWGTGARGLAPSAYTPSDTELRELEVRNNAPSPPPAHSHPHQPQGRGVVLHLDFPCPFSLYRCPDRRGELARSPSCARGPRAEHASWKALQPGRRCRLKRYGTLLSLCHESRGSRVQAVSRVGRERRRRWLNDKLLRDMAGALTAPDMETLFRPPPFGGPGHSAPMRPMEAIQQPGAITALGSSCIGFRVDPPSGIRCNMAGFGS